MSAAAYSAFGAHTPATKPQAALPAHDVAMSHAKILAYIQPYLKPGNFSGSILVVQDGKTLLRDSFGFSDISRQAPNQVDTKFRLCLGGCRIYLTRKRATNVWPHARSFPIIDAARIAD